MKRASLFLAIALLITVSSAAETRRRAVRPAVQVGAWTIEITTSGGFTGSGTGGVTVSSEGKVGILLLGDKKPRCTFDLDAPALESLNRLVTQATPFSWIESYVPALLNARCCDMVTTHMRLTRVEDGREVVYETQWLNAGPAGPFDLAQIISAVSSDQASIRGRYTPLCTRTP